MDNYLDRERWKNYYLAMAQPYASSMNSTASLISFVHLNDGFTKMAFLDDVKRFVNAKFDVIRNPQSSDEECNQSVQELKQELEYLNIQDRMLRLGEAKLHASVSFYHKHEKEIGYVIDGIGVVLGGMQIAAGIGLTVASLSHFNAIGILVDVNLVLNGASSVQENVLRLAGNKDEPGFMKKNYMNAAEFPGFDRKLGMLAYQTVD